MEHSSGLHLVASCLGTIVRIAEPVRDSSLGNAPVRLSQLPVDLENLRNVESEIERYLVATSKSAQQSTFDINLQVSIAFSLGQTLTL